MTRGCGAATRARDTGVRHLYVHVPFCAHRCGYCDFVTVVGRDGLHEPYATALLSELERERHRLATTLETVFLGGGTPTMLSVPVLERLLRSLPKAAEVTVEANPETVTPEIARLLATCGVTRVSLGVQSFQEPALELLERRARPETVRRAFRDLRAAGIDNISLDLLYGVPGQTPADLERDLGEALALAPEHLSCYELEAKPGTRFAHAHGRELALQSESMEGYFEQVIEILLTAGYHWYETSNFCRPGRQARHNLGVWLGHDYLGIGIGAVSTVGLRRWRNRPALGRYCAALRDGREPPREVEPLDARLRDRERLMLGLRLDRALDLGAYNGTVDPVGVERMAGLGLLVRDGEAVRLTRRGRMLGGGVTVELLAESPA